MLRILVDKLATRKLGDLEMMRLRFAAQYMRENATEGVAIANRLLQALESSKSSQKSDPVSTRPAPPSSAMGNDEPAAKAEASGNSYCSGVPGASTSTADVRPKPIHRFGLHNSKSNSTRAGTSAGFRGESSDPSSPAPGGGPVCAQESISIASYDLGASGSSKPIVAGYGLAGYSFYVLRTAALDEATVSGARCKSLASALAGLSGRGAPKQQPSDSSVRAVAALVRRGRFVLVAFGQKPAQYLAGLLCPTHHRFLPSLTP